ncbi:hypothetical protein JCM8097_008382 [Rhodosporidiobolus ruineniae]
MAAKPDFYRSALPAHVRAAARPASSSAPLGSPSSSQTFGSLLPQRPKKADKPFSAGEEEYRRVGERATGSMLDRRRHYEQEKARRSEQKRERPVEAEQASRRKPAKSVLDCLASFGGETADRAQEAEPAPEPVKLVSTEDILRRRAQADTAERERRKQRAAETARVDEAIRRRNAADSDEDERPYNHYLSDEATEVEDDELDGHCLDPESYPDEFWDCYADEAEYDNLVRSLFPDSADPYSAAARLRDRIEAHECGKWPPPDPSPDEGFFSSYPFALPRPRLKSSSLPSSIRDSVKTDYDPDAIMPKKRRRV